MLSSFDMKLKNSIIGGSHQLISSDVIDLMGQLFDLITNANFANSAATTVLPPGGLAKNENLLDRKKLFS